MTGTGDTPVSATRKSGYGDFLVPGVVQKQGVREVKRPLQSKKAKVKRQK
jgi:hypothetical protein